MGQVNIFLTCPTNLLLAGEASSGQDGLGCRGGRLGTQLAVPGVLLGVQLGRTGRTLVTLGTVTGLGILVEAAILGVLGHVVPLCQIEKDCCGEVTITQLAVQVNLFSA